MLRRSHQRLGHPRLRRRRLRRPRLRRPRLRRPRLRRPRLRRPRLRRRQVRRLRRRGGLGGLAIARPPAIRVCQWSIAQSAHASESFGFSSDVTCKQKYVHILPAWDPNRLGAKPSGRQVWETS